MVKRREKISPEYNSLLRLKKSPKKPSQKQNQDLQEALDTLHVRRVVAGNPNTPESVLKRLSYDKFSIIRRHVAENPHTPKDTLKHLASDESVDVRLSVTENANTPPETLASLACDQDVDIRFGVAENPHMPQDILLDLAHDENPYVRCRALKTLNMLAPD